jgi:multiple sugar transport system substrate-binding protein
MDYAYILNYVNKGQLMDLTPLVASGAIDLSKVPDSAISGGRFGEGLYGINAGSNGLCMAVNEKLVKEAGMEVPSNEMTWEEFEAWVIEFHEKTGKYGTDLFGLKDYNGVFRIFAREHGEELYNKAQDGAGFSAETLAAYFASIKRIQDAGATQNIADAVTDIGKENYPMSKGEAATIFTVTDSYTTYAAVLKDSFGAVPLRILPGAAATKAMFVKPSQFLSIAATAEQVDAAAKFINYWVNDEEANLFIAGRRGVPINPDIATLVGQSLSEESMMVFEYMNLMAGYASDLYAPDPQAHGEIADEYNRQAQAVLYGESTPEAAAQALVDYINKALKQ